jgi:hypothetical protein
MANCYILNVDIVAHSRAVTGRIVVAKDLQEGKVTVRHSCQGRHQVVRRAKRIFADQRAAMSPSRVEVA